MKNILIILNGPIPGLANTNRILSIARGMKEIGINVKVLSYSILFNSSLPNVSNYKRVPYYCFSFKTKLPKILRLFWYFFNILLLAKYVFNSRKKLDCLYVYSDNLLYILLFGFLGKICKTKLIIERTEHPYFILKDKNFKQLYKIIYSNIFKLVDGLIIISKELEYYKFFLKNKIKPIVIPIIVESDLFNNIENIRPIYKKEYIAYCGDMNGQKDDVKSLILSFSQLSQNINNIDLILLGPYESNFSLIELVNSLNLNKRIFFLGNVSRDCLLNYLFNAKILALAKYNNIQNRGNFPSKIAEYLLTGKPVITTAIGVIEDYLTNRKNAYLVKPNDVTTFAITIEQIIFNYEEAKLVGENGKKIAIEIFDYKKHAVNILNYINSITLK